MSRTHVEFTIRHTQTPSGRSSHIIGRFLRYQFHLQPARDGAQVNERN